jgi:hypothetical protein
MLRLLNGKIIVFEFLKDKSKQHHFKNKIKILNWILIESWVD